jgi:transposase-like protein
MLPAWANVSADHRGFAAVHMHGLSSGDFAPAREQFPRHRRGPAASPITRLTTLDLSSRRRCAGLVESATRVFPQTNDQRCGSQTGDWLAALPRSAHPGASLGDEGNLQRRGRRQGAGGDHRVRTRLRREAPKAVAKIGDDADTLLDFCQYRAEHWIHLRTTNPVEPPFAAVRLRIKVTKCWVRGRPRW